MANEITALRGVANAEGDTNWRLFYYWPLSTRIQDFNGNDLIVQNSANIDSRIAAIVPAAFKTAIDSGDGIYIITDFVQTAGESGAAALARIKLHYAAVMPVKEAAYRAEFAKSGQQFNAA